MIPCPKNSTKRIMIKKSVCVSYNFGAIAALGGSKIVHYKTMADIHHFNMAALSYMSS